MNPRVLATELAADAAFVDRVQRRLSGVLEASRPGPQDTSRVADQAARHLTAAPAAKRARPRLVHHFGGAIGVEERALVDLAAAAELMHTASLLHDDVVDEAATRRGQPAANVRWGNQVAILGGDLLLCYSLKLLEPYPSLAHQAAVDTILEMTRSVVREVEARFDVDVALADWRQIADGKTAVLLGWCGYAPAVVADQIDVAERFDRCGRHLGVAFQLADDLKDLLAADTGKDRFADIRNGNPSHVLICAIEASPEVGAQLEALWGDRRGVDDDVAVERAGRMVLDTDAPQRTIAALEHEVSCALSALGELADRPEGARLRRWVDLLVRSVEQMR